MQLSAQPVAPTVASVNIVKGLLDNSRIRQLADWTTRGLDISRMPPATLRA